MSIVVTGATGHLGRLAVEALLNRGVPSDQVVATGRDAAKLAELRSLGVEVRRADYTDLASLKEAFVGADRLLFVSSSEVGQRVDQHRNVVSAARDADIGMVAYTSIHRADTTSLLLAHEHKATEQLITESGLRYVFLRNAWYLENYTAQIPTALDHGVLTGAAADGRVSAATRADYAEAAAVAVTTDDLAGRTCELGGDQAFTMTEFAAALSAQSGTHVTYQNLPTAEYAALLAQLGLPPAAAEVYADADAGVARGELLVDSRDLSRLIGRPTTTADQAITAALA